MPNPPRLLPTQPHRLPLLPPRLGQCARNNHNRTSDNSSSPALGGARRFVPRLLLSLVAQPSPKSFKTVLNGLGAVLGASLFSQTSVYNKFTIVLQSFYNMFTIVLQ